MGATETMLNLYVDLDAHTVFSQIFRMAQRYRLELYVVTADFWHVDEKVHLIVAQEDDLNSSAWIAANISRGDTVSPAIRTWRQTACCAAPERCHQPAGFGQATPSTRRQSARPPIRKPACARWKGRSLRGEARAAARSVLCPVSHGLVSLRQRRWAERREVEGTDDARPRKILCLRGRGSARDIAVAGRRGWDMRRGDRGSESGVALADQRQPCRCAGHTHRHLRWPAFDRLGAQLCWVLIDRADSACDAGQDGVALDDIGQFNVLIHPTSGRSSGG
jgi:hypothetical protein